MRLDYGEFTVEEEKEYFDYRITEIFQTLHKQKRRTENSRRR